MNGSVQRTIPDVMLPFRSMISKSFSVADNGLEYQVRGNLAPDIFRRVFTLPEACLEYAKVPRICQARLILPAVPDGPAFGLRPAVSEKPFIMETKYQVPHNAAPDISCRWFVF